MRAKQRERQRDAARRQRALLRALEHEPQRHALQHLERDPDGGEDLLLCVCGGGERDGRRLGKCVGGGNTAAARRHTQTRTQFGGVHFGLAMALYQLASNVGTRRCTPKTTAPQPSSDRSALGIFEVFCWGVVVLGGEVVACMRGAGA